MKKEKRPKQMIPVFHLMELADENERELVLSTLQSFAEANVPFCVVDCILDNEEQEQQGVLCLHCINAVPDKDVAEIRDEIFAGYKNIETVAITKMSFKQ